MDDAIKKAVEDRRFAIEQEFYDHPGVKIRCESYINVSKPDCKALNALYCECGVCQFYRRKH